jgi:prepilin-type N-terminal cleavage/methylation domain-containing protein
MVSLKRNDSGFTIVELLIVIIVIGILAALVLVTFSGVQQKARNTERTTDVKAIASHLEVYNAQNSYYPTSGQLTANDGSVLTFIGGNLKGLDKEALRDPKGSNFYLTAGNASSQSYGYVPSPANCDNTAGNECTSFVLTYLPEGGSLTTINSLSN